MPRLAVNMMVVNGEKILRRCLMPLKGAIDELVVIDTGSTDKTKQVLDDLASELHVSRYYYEVLDQSSKDLFSDVKDSWHLDMPGPFTGLPIPKDWARVRNILLECTTADYVLKLDADDEPLCPPENWLRTALHLDTSPHLDLVAAPYEIYDGQGNHFWLSMYDRLWRRESGLRWSQVCHEYLMGKTTANTVYVPSGLRVRDWRDSPGQGARITHRNLKVLLREYEQNDRRPLTEITCNPQDFIFQFTLAHEAVEVFPELARELLQSCVENLWFAGSKDDAPDKAMLADCHYHLGRLFEHTGDVDFALANYERADRFHPHLQALVKMFLLMVKHKTASECRQLQSKILSIVGADLTGRKDGIANAIPYNCDLSLLSKVHAWKG